MAPEEVTNPEGQGQGNPEGSQAADQGSQDQGQQAPSLEIHPDLLSDEEKAGADQDDGQGGEATAPAEGDDGQGEGESLGDDEGGEGGEGSPEPVAVLKYRGQEIKVDSQEKLLELASKGLDYTAKTQMVSPYLKTVQALQRLEATNPKQAAAVAAILRGETPATAKGQESEAGQNQQPMMVKDADGKWVEVDPAFVEAVSMVLAAKGVGPQKPQDQQQAPDQRQDPYVARAAMRELINDVAADVKQRFGRDDFKDAIPLIQEAMLAQGVAPGDPRDNPDTWKSIYAELALTGRIPASNGQQASEVETKKKKHVNKSGEKRAAAGPALDTQRPPDDAWVEPTKKALASGEARDFVEAVKARTTHPDFA